MNSFDVFANRIDRCNDIKELCEEAAILLTIITDFIERYGDDIESWKKEKYQELLDNFYRTEYILNRIKKLSSDKNA